MTQSDWEAVGALVGMLILTATAIWVAYKSDDFDGGW